MQFVNQHHSESACRFNQSEIAFGKSPARLILFILFVVVWAFPLAAQNPHTISGNITLDGSGLGDVKVYATGVDFSGTATTNSNGYYEFTGIPDEADVTITPVDQAHKFSPLSIPLGNIQEDRSGIDFTADELPTAILGRILDEDGEPVQGVSVNGFREGQYDRTVKTNVVGYFHLYGFPPGNRTYTITPQSEGYSFVPADTTVDIHEQQDPYPDLVEFTAQLEVDLYSISGAITDENDDPLVGVEVKATGGHNAITFTDSQGKYAFNDVLEGSENIQLTPFKEDYSFVPEIRQIQKVNRDISGRDFSATSVITYTVSGNIAEGNDPLPGVEMVATGDYNRTVYSDVNGDYEFNGIEEGSDLIITPVLPGYTFTPESDELIDLTSNRTDIDFEAEAINDGTISGEITDKYGNPIGGINVHCDEATPENVTTNAAGFFQFTGLGPGNNPVEATVTPESEEYDFEPPSMTFNNRYDELRHVTGIDFTAILIAFYSRQTGNWNDEDTWSATGHNGPAVPEAPTGDVNIFIGGNDGNDHKVTMDDDVALGDGITLTVYDTGNGSGILSTGETGEGYTVSGGGTFDLQSGGTLHIASPHGITESADEGNIQTAARIYSDQANYVYNGSAAQQTGDGLPVTVNDLTIDNDAPDGVTALQSHTVNGKLVLAAGTLTMPEGASLVTYEVTGNGNVLMQQEISGGKGWRMVSSPVDAITYDDFFDGFVTQGFDGSDYSDLQPNVLWFDETEIGTTNMGWRAPGSAGNALVSGRGYFQYIFDGAGLPPPYEGESYDDNLPITMTAEGQEPAFSSDSWNYDNILTYTPRDPDDQDPEEDEPFLDINMDDSGWNLLGNPTTASLDWGSETAWTRDNIDETFYVWVADENAQGEYRVWNTLIDNGEDTDFTPLSDGLIAPFQGFWVLADNENPSLSFTHDAKTTGGTFHQKDYHNTSYPAHNDPFVLPLRLKADGMNTRAYVAFSESGNKGRDPYDGYHLEPLSQSYLELYTVNLATFSPLVINNLPENLEDDLRIPLYVGGLRNGTPVQGMYSLQWSLPSNWPADWGIILMDHHEEKAIPLTRQTEYHFHHESTTSSKITDKTGFVAPKQVVAHLEDPVKSKGDGNNRFTLVTTPGTVDEEPVYAPDIPALLPAYPNPTQSDIQVQFHLPEEDHVTIRVHDLHGRHIRTLASREFDSGHHTLPASSLNQHSSGIYIITLHSSTNKDSQKITLIK